MSEPSSGSLEFDFAGLVFGIVELIGSLFGMGNSAPQHHHHHHGVSPEEVQRLLATALGEQATTFRQQLEREIANAVAAVRSQSQQAYDRDQPRLARLLNAGLASMNRDRPTVVAIGSKGQGKSTALNIMFGTDFESAATIGDVTTQLNKDERKEANHPTMHVWDTAGFDVSMLSLARFFILLFVQRCHADWLMMVTGDRNPLLVLNPALVGGGLLKLLLLPFTGSTYHRAIPAFPGHTDIFYQGLRALS
jgi:hypothetical protein